MMNYSRAVYLSRTITSEEELIAAQLAAREEAQERADRNRHAVEYWEVSRVSPDRLHVFQALPTIRKEMFEAGRINEIPREMFIIEPVDRS